MNTKKRNPVSAEDFVRAWEATDNLEELSRQLGLPKASLSARAKKYREEGKTLKHLPFSRSRSVNDLVKLLKDIRSGVPMDVPRSVIQPQLVKYKTTGELLRSMLDD